MTTNGASSSPSDDVQGSSASLPCSGSPNDKSTSSPAGGKAPREGPGAIGLGVAIGGATGAFVGTDVSFVVDGVDSNWLRPYVGVEDTATEIEGMVTAGASTALGFTAVQTVQNVTVTPGKNWVD